MVNRDSQGHESFSGKGKNKNPDKSEPEQVLEFIWKLEQELSQKLRLLWKTAVNGAKGSVKAGKGRFNQSHLLK
jgi:hypothetical protein